MTVVLRSRRAAKAARRPDPPVAGPVADLPFPHEQPRYSAFLSYSHADQACVRWLHRALEAYRLPKALIGSPSRFGPVPRRLLPVFRDRDELSASSDLGLELQAALARSRFQIVLCSPRAARSKWVNEEILTFKRLHGEARTLALILDGEPHSGDARECFPPALRFRLAPDGSLSDLPAEPIAADVRPGKDGRRLALLKLISGIAGLPLDALARRDSARKQRRLAVIASVSAMISVLTIGLAIYAEAQRHVAEAQRRLADRSLAFLIGTFAIANPAKENPRTITAVTILDRASRRASSELKDEPEVSARLLRTTGDIYLNLGLLKASERDLRSSLALTPERGEDKARTLLRLAALAFKRGDAKDSGRFVDAAEQAYPANASYSPSLDALVAESRGMTAYLAGQYGKAGSLFEQAAKDYGKLSGDNREEVGRALMNQAQALIQENRLSEADVLLARAVRLYVAKFGMEDVHTASAIQNQALNDYESRRFALAENRIGQALALYGKVLDPQHPKVAAAALLLGRVRTARGESAEALAAFDRARAIYAGLYGDRNAAVGDVDLYAAEAASAQGSDRLALQLLARAKSIYDQSYGPDDPDQVELLLARARVLARADRPAEAARDCSAAIALDSKLQPAGGSGAIRSCAAITRARA